MDLKILAAVLLVATLGIGIAFAAGVQPNATAAQKKYQDTAEHAQFAAAVSNGDWAAAKQLHDTYGFGGPMFDRLTEQTFAKYSSIHKLESQLSTLRGELASELGMNETPRIGRGGFEGGKGVMRGFGGHKPPVNADGAQPTVAGAAQ